MHSQTSGGGDRKVKRPAGVTMIAVVYAFIGFCMVLMGIFVMIDLNPVNKTEGILATRATTAAFAGIAILVLSGFSLMLAWGMWKLRAWAKLTIFVLTVLSLVRSFFELTTGNLRTTDWFEWISQMAGLSFTVWVILYLRGKSVREAFRAASPGEPSEPTMI